MNPRKFITLPCKITGRDAKIMAVPTETFWLQMRERGHVSKVGLAAKPLCTHGKVQSISIWHVSKVGFARLACFPHKSGFVTKCVLSGRLQRTLVKVPLTAFALKHLKYQVNPSFQGPKRTLQLIARCPPFYPAVQPDNKAGLSKGFGSYFRLWRAREDKGKIVLMLSALMKAQQEWLESGSVHAKCWRRKNGSRTRYLGEGTWMLVAVNTRIAPSKVNLSGV